MNIEAPNGAPDSIKGKNFPTKYISVWFIIIIIIIIIIKGGMQAKGIWKQDPEANIWVQGEWKWEVENSPQWGTS